MSKKSFIVSTGILIIFIISIISTTEAKVNKFSVDSIKLISNKPQELPIARIVVPKINLDEALYSKNSRNNDISQNVTILKESIFPDNESSIIFLAAHSGEGKIAYFNDLDKLNIGDTLIIQYKNYNYIYTIDKIFEEDKDGDIEILKSSNNQLVLTTCSRKDMKKQLIVNSNLSKKEEII